jgi:hypothetical protein
MDIQYVRGIKVYLPGGKYQTLPTARVIRYQNGLFHVYANRSLRSWLATFSHHPEVWVKNTYRKNKKVTGKIKK